MSHAELEYLWRRISNSLKPDELLYIDSLMQENNAPAMVAFRWIQDVGRRDVTQTLRDLSDLATIAVRSVTLAYVNAEHLTEQRIDEVVQSFEVLLEYTKQRFEQREINQRIRRHMVRYVTLLYNVYRFVYIKLGNDYSGDEVYARLRRFYALLDANHLAELPTD